MKATQALDGGHSVWFFWDIRLGLSIGVTTNFGEKRPTYLPAQYTAQRRSPAAKPTYLSQSNGFLLVVCAAENLPTYISASRPAAAKRNLPLSIPTSTYLPTWCSGWMCIVGGSITRYI